MFGGMRKKSDNQLALDQRLAFTINHAADVIDVGRSTVYELIRSGKLELVELTDGMKRVTARSIRKLIREPENSPGA